MPSRPLLLGLGFLALVAGGLLTFMVFYRPAPPAASAAAPIQTEWVLVTTHAIPAGALMQPNDMTWADMLVDDTAGPSIVRGSATAAEFVGTVARHSFADHERLTAAALVKRSDTDFLISTLGPGIRAVTLSVDAVQSISGMIFPGDHVDVLLTQNVTGNGTAQGHQWVGETVLHDLRVIAVDQALQAPAPPTAPATDDLKLPKTITLAVTGQQAEMLQVAEQLGRIALTLRGADDQIGTEGAATPPIWASDVSAALGAPDTGQSTQHDGMVDVMHGSKSERLCMTGAGFVTCP